ncbi:hypothetical protein HDU97_009552 [Phlyctochytrium planicorne]|nr:hypothetical protein HDU97_009552 [Phlyctochytrium planicorne]
MSETDGRYVIAYELPEKTPVGFMYFQFLAEESYDEENTANDGEAPAIYCLELQIVPNWQSRGLGTILMKALEKLGAHFEMSKSMLTVFKSNEQALTFYKKHG